MVCSNVLMYRNPELAAPLDCIFTGRSPSPLMPEVSPIIFFTYVLSWLAASSPSSSIWQPWTADFSLHLNQYQFKSHFSVSFLYQLLMYTLSLLSWCLSTNSESFRQLIFLSHYVKSTKCHKLWVVQDKVHQKGHPFFMFSFLLPLPSLKYMIKKLNIGTK